jgi:hypothetical protein
MGMASTWVKRFTLAQAQAYFIFRGRTNILAPPGVATTSNFGDEWLAV